MGPLKVALVIDNLYGGGAEKVVLTLARTMNGLGHDAHVIGLEDIGHYDVTRAEVLDKVDAVHVAEQYLELARRSQS